MEQKEFFLKNKREPENPCTVLLEDNDNNSCVINSKSEVPIPVCEICKINPFKYKCPKCFLKTCSVSCVKTHKKKLKCSGQKEKFSSKTNLNNLNEKDFFRDINSLLI